MPNSSTSTYPTLFGLRFGCTVLRVLLSLQSFKESASAVGFSPVFKRLQAAYHPHTKFGFYTAFSF